MAQNEEIIIDIANQGAGLPDVDSDDNGKVLAVVEGEWDKAAIPSGNLPPVTSADESKILRVSDGAWSAHSIDDIVGKNKVISMYAVNKGFIQGTKIWNYTTRDNYKHLIIPISGGEKLSLIGNASNNTYYAALKTYTNVADGEDVDFSTEAGWTNRVQLNKNISTKVTLPSDGRFLYIAVHSGSNDITPQGIVIDDYNLFLNSSAESISKNNENRAIDMFGVNGIDAPIEWELGSISDGTSGNPLTNSASTTRCRMVRAYKSETPFKVVCDSEYKYRVFLLDNNLNFTGMAFTGWSAESYTIPANTYFRIVAGKSDDSTLSNTDITQYISVKFDRISNMLYELPVKWCALGDSITQGYYSYIDNNDTAQNAVDTEHTWVPLVAKKNNWDVANLGVGGSGFLDPSNNNTTGYGVARSTVFEDYNLVTIAYGINDWKADLPIGTIGDVSQVETPTTVIQAMQITIEAIMTSNPNCKIIGILPMNCVGYHYNYGDKASNYGLGYTGFSNSGTLEEFCAALIEVYEYYGIQYIDMAHCSPVNRENLRSALPDGVHPSLAIHNLMAHELSKKITF